MKNSVKSPNAKKRVYVSQTTAHSLAKLSHDLGEACSKGTVVKVESNPPSSKKPPTRKLRVV